MQKEALSTQRLHQWSSDQKLRNSKVNFISAGTSQPPKLLVEEKDGDNTDALADLTLDGQPSSSPQDTPVETEDEVTEHFVVDAIATTVNTGLPPPEFRSSSPTPSDSSEEVILFRGRDSSGRGIRRTTPPRHASSDPYSTKIKAIEDQIHAQQALLEVTVKEHERETPRGRLNMLGSHASARADHEDHAKSISVDEYRQVLNGSLSPRPAERVETIVVEIDKSRSPSRARSRKRSRQPIKTMRQLKAEEEQALIDDYIANMEDEELDQHMSYNTRELDGDDNDLWVESDTSEPEKASGRVKTGDWDRSDLVDFDDLSTSDGVFGAVQAILSKRERQSGAQYLVVWEDQSVDEARWVPHSILSQPSCLTLIKEFEAEEKLVAEFFGDEDDDDSEDSDDEMYGSGASEDEDDEADLVQRKIDRMTDEKIARLLAKQEELGMGSEQLLLFDDSADGNDSVLDLEFIMPPKRKKTRAGIRAPNRARGEFPAASALADAYDGFDVMDFERPSISLKKKPKGRKSKPEFDLSDSELEVSMAMAWENDRLKKKSRKEDREELRAAGLLGKNKARKPDMAAKYKEGMGIAAVKEEIRRFLMSDNTT